MEKVTVVIPTFNDTLYLEEAILSVKRQTYPSCEIIVVDDGSTNKNDISELERLKSVYSITLLKKENGHLSSARNFGIQHSTSEYIFVLDADDTIDSTLIEKALKLLKSEPKFGAVTTGVQSVGISNERYMPKGGGVENFLASNNACGNSLIRKSVWEQVGGYDEEMKMGYEDWEFWIRVTKYGYLIGVVKEYLFNYRVKETSMYVNSVENSESIIRYIINKHSELYSANYIDIIANLHKKYVKTKLSSEHRIIRLLKMIDDRNNYTLITYLRILKQKLVKKN